MEGGKEKKAMLLSCWRDDKGTRWKWMITRKNGEMGTLDVNNAQDCLGEDTLHKA